MSRTITALFDTKADADAGAERLRLAGIDASHVSVHDQHSHKTTGAYSTSEDKGLWASIKNVFVPHEDRHTYEEGLRRGGVLLTADVDDDKTPAAVAALEEANSVDLDARSQEWRSSGWDYAEPTDLNDDDSIFGRRELDRGGQRFRSYATTPYDDTRTL
jgi:hypothetical protein